MNNLIKRPFSGDSDKLLMAELSSRFPSDHLHLADLPYRLNSWALDEPQNTCLWFDSEGQLQAWAVLQTPFWTIDIACNPALVNERYPEVLTWAVQRAREVTGTAFEHPCWFVQVFSDQPEHIFALEAAGFRSQADVGEDSWSKVLLERPGSLAIETRHELPAGYRIRPLAGPDEATAYVDLHQEVFESKNMTLEWRQRTLLHPAYRPELDLLVEAPDGSLAAFCIAWLHEHNGQLTGQIEPLGCRSSHRRRGLSQLLLAEALRRLQTLRAQVVHVETDNFRDSAMHLYESSGFKVVRDVLIFRLDL